MTSNSKSKISPHLRGSLVPANPSELTARDEEAIATAISALKYFCEHTITDYNKEVMAANNQNMQRRKQELQDTMLKYWEAGLLDWMEYLFRYYYPLDGSRWTVITYVQCALTQVIVRTNKSLACLPFAIMLWEQTEFDYLKSEYASVHGWADSFLTMVFSKEGTAQQIPKEKIAPIVDLLIIRLMARKGDLDGTSNLEFSFLVMALWKILPLDNPTGGRLIRIIRRMTDVLRWMSDVIIPNPEFDDEYDTCIHTYFTLFHTIEEKLKNTKSIEALCEAIRHGLLISILRFGDNWNFESIHFPLAPIARSAMYYFLSEHIPMFIYYNSVLKAMETIMVYQGTNFAEPVVASMTEVWRGLCDRYKLIIRWQLESNANPLASLCDNPTHQTNTIPASLYKCSGCDSTWYCSKECQKAHWDKTHRNECNNLRLLNSSSTHTKLGRRDCTLILHMSIKRVMSEWEAALEIAKRKYPRKKMSQLSVVINYTLYPPAMDIVARDRAAVKAALAIGPQATTVQCIVPFGRYVATLTAAGDISKTQEDAGWFAGRSLITYSLVHA